MPCFSKTLFSKTIMLSPSLSPVTERQVSYGTVQKPHVSKPATKHISIPKATNSETILIVEASAQHSSHHWDASDRFRHFE